MVTVVVSNVRRARPLAEHFPLTNNPGVPVGVDFSGALPTMARRYSYILLLKILSSPRADIFTVTVAEVTAERTVNILVNCFILLGYPSNLLSDN